MTSKCHIDKQMLVIFFQVTIKATLKKAGGSSIGGALLLEILQYYLEAEVMFSVLSGWLSVCL